MIDLIMRRCLSHGNWIFAMKLWIYESAKRLNKTGGQLHSIRCEKNAHFALFTITFFFSLSRNIFYPPHHCFECDIMSVVFACALFVFVVIFVFACWRYESSDCTIRDQIQCRTQGKHGPQWKRLVVIQKKKKPKQTLKRWQTHFNARTLT